MQRFFEGRQPREIARLAGVPAGTVRSRIARALTRLRRRLDPGDEDARATFLAALAPLAVWRFGPLVVPAGPASASLWPGALIVTAKLPLFALAVLSLALAWRFATGSAPAEVAQDGTAVARGPDPDRGLASGALAPAAEAPARAASGPEATWLVHGTAWVGTSPLPDCEVELELAPFDGGPATRGTARTDAAGAFTWGAPPPLLPPGSA